jgi:hypothetical protein
MKFRLDEQWLQAVRDEYFSRKAAGDGKEELGIFLSEKAAVAGISRKTLYAKLDLGVRTVTVKKEVIDKWATIDQYARMVFDLAAKKSKGDFKVDWDLTFEVLQESGQIPSDIKMWQIYNSITKRQNLPTLSQAVLKTIKRDHPLSLVHIDYSVSRYFKYDSRDESVVLVESGDGYYKNANDKDEDGKAKRLRVWFCSAIDQASGVMFAQYVLARGESPHMTQLFLQAAFSEKNRLVGVGGEYVTEELLQGMPTAVYWDRGPGHKTLTVRGLKELEIGYITGGNKMDGFGKKTNRSNKGAHGMVENMNGQLKKRFETKILLQQRGGYKTTIDDLNEGLRKWCCEKNCSRHPVQKDVTRWSLFEPVLGSLRLPPDNFLAYFAGVFKRKVSNRMVSFEGQKYVTPEIARNDSEIDVMEDNGAVYAIIGGRRYEMHPIDEYHRQGAVKESENESDLLDGRELKVRLDTEIKRISEGEIALSQVKISHQDDLIWFFESARTVADIREFASRLVSERAMRPPRPVARPAASNIITLPRRD